jgi:hypothetical protein
VCVGASQPHGHKASMPKQNNITTNKIKMPQGIRYIVHLVMLISYNFIYSDHNYQQTEVHKYSGCSIERGLQTREERENSVRIIFDVQNYYVEVNN